MIGKIPKPKPNGEKKNAKSREDRGVAKTSEINADMLSKYFDEALKASDPKPSRDACEKLCNQIFVVLQQTNKSANRRISGDQIRKSGGKVSLCKLKDVSPLEPQQNRFRIFQEISTSMLGVIKDMQQAICDIEENDGSCLFTDKHGQVWAADLEELLLRAIAIPAAPRPAAHRRVEIWHEAAAPIAKLIKATLAEAHHKRNLNPKNENSPIAVAGARVINAVYHLRIKPSGFASAIRNRDRTKPELEGDFFKRFPEAARIKRD